MNEKEVKNPQAFPAVVSFTTDNYYKGITLRDYFAAKAMNGIVQGLTTAGPDAVDSQKILWEDRWGDVSIIDCIAKDSYMIAGAMLKERMNHLK